MKVLHIYSAALLLLGSSLVTYSFFIDRSMYTGSLQPTRPSVCNGQYVTFQCSLTSPPSAAKTLIFASSAGRNGYVIADENNIIRINETTANFTLLVIPNAYMTVKCFYGQRDDVSKRSLNIGQPVMFPALTSPREVENFRCIVDNYEVMKCSWTYGIKYFTDLKPNLTLEWQVFGETQWKHCPELNSDKTQCFWRRLSNEVTWFNKLRMRITLTQACNASVTSNMTIDTTLLVKPSPVSSLTSHVVNKTCIQLRWKKSVAPENATNNSLIYRIQIHSRWNNSQAVVNGTEQDGTVITIQCGLEEHTVYRFMVSQRPSEGGFWSDEKTVECTTPKDIPSSSPELIHGGYYWDPSECTNDNGRRTVCLLWKNIPAIDENGKMRGIGVTFTPTGSDIPEVKRLYAEDATYGCVRLSCDKTYVASVIARNEIGESMMTSSIIVQKWCPSTRQPTFTAEVAKGEPYVYITFEPPSSHITDIYVSWCVNNMGQCSNDGEVNWLRLSPDETEARIATSHAERYAYAVSMVDKQVSFGAHWEQCIYTRGAAPSVAPDDVTVVTGPDDNTLIVTWEKLPCRSGEPIIKAYWITYCLAETGKCSMKEVPGNTSRLILGHLIADKEYTVQVQATAAEDVTSPFSPVAKGTPDNKSLKLHEIIAILLGGLTMVILASIGCVCAIRLLRERTRRWKREVGGIKLPEQFAPPLVGLEDTTKSPPNLKVRSLSADSGVPPTPSPTVLDESNMTWGQSE